MTAARKHKIVFPRYQMQCLVVKMTAYCKTPMCHAAA